MKKGSLEVINSNKPSKEEAEEAVRTLIKWAGDDPGREGLVDTPRRVVDSYKEFFSGYESDPGQILSRTFDEVEDYDEIVLLKGMNFESHCEHHIVPIIGKAHIAYIPDGRVVGISKLARVVDAYAKRLQTQEVMTVQIANAIETHLRPKGIAIVIDAVHQCMTTRGVYKTEASTVTSRMLGIFREDSKARSEFMSLIANS